jgi:carbon monoxide dehydrogenase subunit G
VTFGDFYVMFQRENRFINKRIQKPRRLNMKCIPAVNSVNKTNQNRYNLVLKISCNIFFLPTETVIVVKNKYVPIKHKQISFLSNGGKFKF